MKRFRSETAGRWCGHVLAATLLLTGCATPAYYWQAAEGQLELWRLARPLAEAQADPALPAALRQRLAQAAEIRAFAVAELGLPDNGSYRRYADLKRPYVVWNVFAAESLSVQAKQWCFPVAGCVAYRGYFAEAEARAYGARLAAQGYDVHVAGVPAYSTLGWFDDPLLSTFIHYPETELARLIFHELAHQVAYAGGDTEFNESFAVAVEQVGVERWLGRRRDAALAAAFGRAQAMRADFAALVGRYRARLEAVYAAAGEAEEKLRRKAQVIAELRMDYDRLKADRWGGFAGYDRWFGQDINNATLASVGLYSALVPEFRALLERQGDDLGRFYAEVRRLAALPSAGRREELALPGPAQVRSPAPGACPAFPEGATLGMLCRPVAAAAAAPAR